MNDSLAFFRAMDDRRRIDRIMIVTDDIPLYQSRLQKYFDYSAGKFYFETEKDMPDCLIEGRRQKFSQYRIDIPLADDRELCIIQPVEGVTPASRYLAQYGPGVMGLRELVPADLWELWQKHVKEANLPVLATNGDYAMMVDLRDRLGCVMAVMREDMAEPKGASSRRIGQVCIVTDDIHRTAEDMTGLLGVGPWEIGHINNRSADYLKSAEHPENLPKADFLAGIAFYGDLEFELIQPLEGPLPYFDFLERHGTGFQHIKEILTPTTWEEANRHYRELGVPIALAGKVGQCSFNNLNAVPLLGVVYELSDGVPMTKLPEGYDPYIYPAV